MKKSVWVIEQGSYSDYHVVGVFSSQANAAFILQSITGDDKAATIEEWPLDPAVSELSAGLTQWRGEMLRDGTMERCTAVDAIHGHDLSAHVAIWKRATAPAYRGTGVQDCLKGIVWAKDRIHAIKIFNEHRTQLIAQNTWKEPA